MNMDPADTLSLVVNAMDPIEADTLFLAAVNEHIAAAVDDFDSDKLTELSGKLISHDWHSDETRSVAETMAHHAYSAALDIRLAVNFEIERMKTSLKAMLVARRIERIARTRRHQPKHRRQLRRIARDLRNAWAEDQGFDRLPEYGRAT